MLFLKILGWTLLVLVVLVTIILFIPVEVLLSWDESGLTGPVIRILGYRLKRKQDPAFLLKLLGFHELTREGALQQSIKTGGLLSVVKKLARSVRYLLHEVGFLLKHLHIRKLHFSCINGGSDAAQAAIEYGQICAVLYPLLGYVESVIRGDIKDRSIDIRCDFDRQEPLLSLDMIFSVRVAFLVKSALILMIKNRRSKRTENKERLSKGEKGWTSQ